MQSRRYLLIISQFHPLLIDVALCNWVQGIDRHPARLHAATGGVQRTPAVDLRAVPRERLIDTGFWFVLYRMAFLTQSQPRGPALLYDTLLPALTDMPVLSHAAAAPPMALRWRDPPLSGDVSHAALSLVALEAMLCANPDPNSHVYDPPHPTSRGDHAPLIPPPLVPRGSCARGFTPSQAAYLVVLVKWEALQIGASELSHLPSISVRSPRLELTSAHGHGEHVHVLALVEPRLCVPRASRPQTPSSFASRARTRPPPPPPSPTAPSPSPRPTRPPCARPSSTLRSSSPLAEPCLLPLPHHQSSSLTPSR